MISNRITWIICTLGFGALLIPISIAFSRDYKIYTEGKFVTATVTYVPNSWGTRSKGKLWFNYNGNSYYVMVTGQVNNIFHPGDTIQLRYLKGYEQFFKLPNDNPIPWGVTTIVTMIFGVIASIYYLFNLPSSIKK